MLETISGFEWQKQITVCDGKYQLDFLLGTQLIVEYENQHDSESINEIREWFKENIFYDNWNIQVIQVKRGFECEGIREVIDHLVAYELLFQWNYEARREEVEDNVFIM